MVAIDRVGREPEEVPFDFEPIIRDAIDRNLGRRTDTFSVTTFALAVREAFHLQETPTQEWCLSVLLGKIKFVSPVLDHVGRPTGRWRMMQ